MRRRFFKHTGEDGVALVITLIMLAVVTFLAVAYLAMSRREQSAINTSEEQNRARLMAEAGFNHLQSKVLANIFTYTNANAYDLLVSTNMNNPYREDFNARMTYPREGYLTNVCLYDTNGWPVQWGVDDLRANLGNLQVSPVVPVFYNIVENGRRTNEFRFYLDFNRNGVFDVTRMTNHIENGRLETFQWGDPQWIGVLQNPNLPHSASNRFVGRFAYIGVPVGKTLDINYMHNNMRRNTLQLDEYAYQRGQGSGSWDLNLAAFFRELNPLQWKFDEYRYPAMTNQFSGGYAFSDALEVLRYRYDNNYGKLSALNDEVWMPSEAAYADMSRLVFQGTDLNLRRRDVVDRFRYDLQDATGDGPVVETAYRIGDSESDWDRYDNDTEERLREPWVASDNPKKFFDIQELVNDSLFSPDMVARIQGRFENDSFTDAERYLTNDVAFYKLISQLSADSVAPASDRIPLNYTTVATSGKTNFIPWTANALTASNFFRVTANRLLKTYYNVGLTDIQIYPTNQYTADVHRLFQLTANIYDAMTNRPAASGKGPCLPTVFRPLYQVKANCVYLAGFELATNNATQLFQKGTFTRIVRNAVTGAGADPANVTVSTFAGYVDNDGVIRKNVVGIPWVIAARKGYPNFNEQELMTDIQLTRKIGLTRQNKGVVFNVNDMWVQYVLGISNRMAFESWNSYLRNENSFRRPLNVRVTNRVTTALWHGGYPIKVATMTNSWGNPTQYSNYVSRVMATNVLAKDLRDWQENAFKVMTSSNMVFVPNMLIETYGSGGAVYSTNMNEVTLRPKDPAKFYHGADFLKGPPLYLTVTNQITYIAIDNEDDWLVDYVTIEKTNLVNLTDLMRGNVGTPGQTEGTEQALWDPAYGIHRQIEISLGNVDDNNTWMEYGTGGNERQLQIDGFRQFCGLTNSLTANGIPDRQGSYRQTPYNPTVHKVLLESLQVNDPLVHYHPDDLVYFTNVYTPLRAAQIEAGMNEQVDPSNIGKVNNFYVPWGGNPDKDITGYRASINVMGLKDPNVTSSDCWDFPTNWYYRPFAYPTIGWLGKVHRGTPWQTVYLKSSAVSEEDWERWSGRKGSHPTNDWRLMDIFTTAINKNAARGALSVNQTNMAAWAAVLGGVTVLQDTNSSTLIVPQTDLFHRVVEGINATRAKRQGGSFAYQGEVLSSPTLTVSSPYWKTWGSPNPPALDQKAEEEAVPPEVNDAVVEWLPMQIMSLLREDNPAYVVYAYGQSLVPAPGAVVLAPGQYRGMVTNYVVTAEYATKTMFRIENAPQNPKVVIDSFDILPIE